MIECSTKLAKKMDDVVTTISETNGKLNDVVTTNEKLEKALSETNEKLSQLIDLLIAKNKD
jgi:hypothetical protein